MEQQRLKSLAELMNEVPGPEYGDESWYFDDNVESQSLSKSGASEDQDPVPVAEISRLKRQLNDARVQLRTSRLPREKQPVRKNSSSSDQRVQEMKRDVESVREEFTEVQVLCDAQRNTIRELTVKLQKSESKLAENEKMIKNMTHRMNELTSENEKIVLSNNELKSHYLDFQTMASKSVQRHDKDQEIISSLRATIDHLSDRIRQLERVDMDRSERLSLEKQMDDYKRMSEKEKAEIEFQLRCQTQRANELDALLADERRGRDISKDETTDSSDTLTVQVTSVPRFSKGMQTVKYNESDEINKLECETTALREQLLTQKIESQNQLSEANEKLSHSLSGESSSGSSVKYYKFVLESAQRENRSLKEINDHLTAKLENKMQEVEDLRRKSENSRVLASSESTELSEELQVLDGEILTLKNALSAEIRNRSVLKVEFERCVEEKSDMEQRSKGLESMMTEYEKKVKSMAHAAEEESKRKQTQWRKRVGEASNEMRKLEEENYSLRQFCGEKETQWTEIQEARKREKMELHQSQAELALLKTEQSQLLDRISKSSEKCRTLEQALAEKKEECSAIIEKERDDVVKQAEKDVAEIQQKIDVMEKEYEERIKSEIDAQNQLEQSYDIAFEEFEVLDEKYAHLEKKFKKIRGVSRNQEDNIESLSGELWCWKQHFTDILRMYNSCSRELGDLRTAYIRDTQKAQRQLKDMELDHESKLMVLKGQLSSLEDSHARERKVWQQKVDEGERKILDQVKELQQKYSLTKADLERANSALAQTREEYQSSKDEVAKAKVQVQDSRNQYEEMWNKEKFRMSQSQNSAQLESNSMKEKLHELDKQLKVKEDECKRLRGLEQSIKQQRTAEARYSKFIRILQRHREKLKAKVDEYRERIRKYQGHLMNTSDSLQLGNLQLEDLDGISDVNSSRSEAADANDTLESMGEELFALDRRDGKMGTVPNAVFTLAATSRSRSNSRSEEWNNPFS